MLRNQVCIDDGNNSIVSCYVGGSNLGRIIFAGQEYAHVVHLDPNNAVIRDVGLGSH